MQEEQNNRDEYFMRLAISEAQAAYEEGEIPVGAVIVANGRVIARAHNQTETLHDVTAHAEMLAITSAASMLGGKYLNGCTLYVTVEPCVMCAGALGWAQLSRIVFGAPDEKRGYSTFAPKAFHPKTKVTRGVLEKDCKALMQSFFASRR
ncbi:nucleoside deaminase [Hallella multisaccharivorax]|uniref:nucleoside deaminase n=1 Tax=Hallella multisaccharivorax TaxID=310514 RepID=UPI00361AE29C